MTDHHGRSRARGALLVPVVALALVTAACGTAGTGGDAASSPRPEPPTTSVAPSPTPTPSSPAPGALPPDIRERPRVAAALADAATRSSVDPSQVVVAAFTPVTWNDGSLGCPQKGMAYTQAEVPGELLIVRVGSALMQYHARTEGPFAYCATPAASYVVG